MFKIGQWAEANGYRIAVPDREINISNARPIRRDDESYVTEIQYPLEEGEEEQA
jgi:effector-binding domain-containing protein